MPSAATRARARRAALEQSSVHVGPNTLATPEMHFHEPPDLSDDDLALEDDAPPRKPTPLVQKELKKKEKHPLSRPRGE